VIYAVNGIYVENTTFHATTGWYECKESCEKTTFSGPLQTDSCTMILSTDDFDVIRSGQNDGRTKSWVDHSCPLPM